MDLRMKRQTLHLFSDLFQRKQQVGRIRFRPQKRERGQGLGYTGTRLPRSVPEREGLSSRQLLDFSAVPRSIPRSTPIP